MTACRHLFISGKVQGVAYRESMRREAEKLRISGWVRNLDDGRVEAVICGTPDQIDAMLAWTRRGPLLARVSDVESSAQTGQFAGFEIH